MIKRCGYCTHFESIPCSERGECEELKEALLQDTGVKATVTVGIYNNADKCEWFSGNEDYEIELANQEQMVDQATYNGVKAGIDFPGSM